MESNKEANLDVTDYVGEWLKKMKHFPQIFEELTVMQKRDFLRMIIEKVVWDGEIAHIYIRNPVPGRHWDIFCPSEGRNFTAVVSEVSNLYPVHCHSRSGLRQLRSSLRKSAD